MTNPCPYNSRTWPFPVWNGLPVPVFKPPMPPLEEAPF